MLSRKIHYITECIINKYTLLILFLLHKKIGQEVKFLPDNYMITQMN